MWYLGMTVVCIPMRPLGYHWVLISILLGYPWSFLWVPRSDPWIEMRPLGYN